MTSLRKIKNLSEVCKLPRDNFEYRDWCIMTDGVSVWISRQKLGQAPTDHIRVPKIIFDRLLVLYEHEQNCP